MSKDFEIAVNATESATATIYIGQTEEEYHNRAIDEYYRTLRHEVAETVKFCRKVTGMSQKDLADKIGTSQPAIARFERGEWESIDHAQKVLAPFHLMLTVRDVLSFEAPKEHSNGK